MVFGMTSKFKNNASSFEVVCIFFLLFPLVQSFNLSSLNECDVAHVLNKTINYKIWVLVPFDAGYKFARDRLSPALKLAIDDARKDFLKQYPRYYQEINSTRIEISYSDTSCNAEKAVAVASDIRESWVLDNKCNGTNNTTEEFNIILGAPCDYGSGRVGALANHWNWPLIYPGARTSIFDTKIEQECCSTMVRTSVTATNVATFLLKFLDRFDWNTTVVFGSSSSSHGAAVDYTLWTDMSTFLGKITVMLKENPSKYTYKYESFATDSDIESDPDAALRKFRERARVSVWFVGRRAMRKIMRAAEKQEMTNGEYAFIYLDLYNTNTSYFWTDEDDHIGNSTSADNSDYSTQYMDDYLRALTVISLKLPLTDQFKQFSESVKNSLNYPGSSVVEYNQYVNPFITSHYDGMVVLLNGVLRTLCNDASDTEDGEEFAELLWGTTFQSLGRTLSVAENGDVSNDFSVLDMNNVTKKFEVVLNYNGSSQEFEEVGMIDWPGSEPPKNIPDCGFVCPVNEINPLYYILGASAGVLLLAIILITVLYKKMQHEKRLRMKLWKVKWDDIEWTKKRRLSASGSKDSAYSITSSNAGYQHLIDKQVFAKTGIYKGNLVAVKEIKRRTVSMDRSLLLELEQIYAMDHDHICKFIGAVDEAPHVSILTEYCARGSLQDLLENDYEYEMDDVFKNSLIGDIIKGMTYLHRSYFQYHGYLKSSNCLIDSRFVVKLTDFGLAKFREGNREESFNGHKHFENKLWTAPELLRLEQAQGSQKGDVYSFAIIVQEIIYRNGVFYIEDDLSPEEILRRVKSCQSSALPFRPTTADDDDVVWNTKLKKLICNCWLENPTDRPSFPEIQKAFRKMFRERNLVDSLLQRLENYSQHLEEKVEERTELYKSEKDRADSLLYQMLPKGVAEQLKKGNNVLPCAFESVTIFFSDIVGFTAISHRSKPMEVVNMLNDLYTMFDQVIEKFDVYKVETIGDAYMVVSGLPKENGTLHAREIARMSLILLDCVNHKFKIRHMPDTQLKLRVGIHTGPVVAGVVGLKMPRYCLFGDTVNTAARMESNGKALAIHVSPMTKAVLDTFGTFELEEREEEVFLKGLGNWKTFWLIGEEKSFSIDGEPGNRFLESSQDDKTDEQIVSYENETYRGKEAISPVVTTGLSVTGVQKHPPILKERKISLHTRGSHKASKKERRHRYGIIEKSNLVDGSTSAALIFNEREKRKEDLEARLSDLLSDGDVTVSVSPKVYRKVHFIKTPNSSSGRSSVESLKNEPQSGRDSGVEIGCVNPMLDINSEEIDEL